MLMLESTFVNSSFVIPAHIREETIVIARNKVEYAWENMDVVDNICKTRKRRASNENESRVAFGAACVNVPRKKYGKQNVSQSKKH